MAVNFTDRRNRDNSFQQFQTLIKDTKSAPSLNNLYGVEFGQPLVLQEAYGPSLVPGGILSGDLATQLNHYAESIGAPSRNLTTATVNNIGSAYKYATGQSHSEIQISFIMPRDMRNYTFFERWMNLIHNDTSQYVDLLENYTCTMKIYKMERGQGKKVFYNESQLIQEQQNPADATVKKGFYYENQVTGVWCLADVFPYNLSQVEFTSGQAAYTTFTVGFQYRNFRFYPNDANISLSTKYESGQNPQQNYLNSLGSDAAKFFQNTDGAYTELFGNNFDFGAIAKPENYTFNPSTFLQPPGTEPLNFWGNTAPDNNG